MDDLDFGATIRGFSAGQRVFQRFVLERILGRGGMGVVWLAHDEKLDEPVALKFLPEVVKLDAVALGDLRKETKRARQLTHPNIVRIHDLLEEPHMAAIAMEAVDGTTLSQLRMERPAQVFGVAEISGWLPQLAAALDYAHHDARVVHRDLKPANIMLDRRGRLKVTDFGVSQSLTDSVSRASAQKSSSGTPAYMSPQQMLGERTAPTDDIYALGATIYELLTGKPPFHSGNIILQVQSVTPPPMAQRRAELEKPAEMIPPEWEAAIAACLDKSAARRPRSAGELLQRLGLTAGVAPVEITDDALPVAQPEGAPVAVELEGAQRLEFLPVPAGEFVLGSPAEEPGRYEDESPRTQVQVTRVFWLGKAPISHAQWRAVMGSGLIDQVRLALEDDREYSIDGKNQTQRAYWGMARDADPARMLGPKGDDVVMHYVSWEDAREFCRRLTERERAAGRLPAGLVFDLPTEAEWEYACRAGTRTATPAGPIKIAGAMNAPVLDAIAWYGGNSSVRFSGEGWDTANWKEKQYPGGSAGPRNVGLKRPNPWGLHDMLGNTWEWCLDLYAKYPGGVVVDPIASGELSSRVCRGGAWNSPARDCRSGARNWLHGGVRRSSIGFRVALVADRPAPMPPPPAPGETSMADTEQYPTSPASGRAWRVALAGGTALPMRWMPPGDFVMGSPEGEAGAYDEEGPRLEVRLTHGFWLGRTPVTQGQWRAVMGGSPKTQVAKFLADTRQYKLGDKQQTLREYWELPADTDPGSRVGDELSGLPMYYVTWSDAMDFCAKLTELERAAGRLPPGYEYTLPTEAQWEYACRAGTTAATYAGDIEILGDCHAPVLDGIAWYSGNSSVGFNGIGWDTSKWIDKQYPGGRAAPRLVAAKEPNAWGLHDMLGNVWEWCFDGYWKYPGGKVTDPVGNPEGATRISRGGAWNGKARDCRAACRNWTWSYLPNYNMGFRVALAPVLPRPAALPERAGAPAAPAAAPPTIIGGSTVLRKQEPSGREKLVLIAVVLLVILAAVAAVIYVRSGRRAGVQPAEELPVVAVAPAEAAREQRREDRRMEYRASGRIYVAPGEPLASARSIAKDDKGLYIVGSLPDGTRKVVRAQFADYGQAVILPDAKNPYAITVGGGYIYTLDLWPSFPRSVYRMEEGESIASPYLSVPAFEGPDLAALAYGIALRDDLMELAVIDAKSGMILAQNLGADGGTRTLLGWPSGYLARTISSDRKNGYVYLSAESPNGSPIVALNETSSANAGVPTVARIPAGGQVLSRIWRGEPLVNPFELTSNGQIVFISDPDAGNVIWCCPLEGGLIRRLEIEGVSPSRIGGLTSTSDRLYIADAGTGAVYSVGALPSLGQLLYGRYADDPAINWETNGFGYVSIEGGLGEPATNEQVVTFRFTAYLDDGTVVSGGGGERGLVSGRPEAFAPGIAVGLKLGGEGAKMRLFVPPHLNSALMFDGTPPPAHGAGVIVDLEIIEIRDDK
jgi:formylglycine-generating enzyme required for sulfatase activity